MEKFEVEYDRKTATLEFYDPIDKEREDWLTQAFGTEKDKGALEKQYNETSEKIKALEKEGKPHSELDTEMTALNGKLLETVKAISAKKDAMLFGLLKDGSPLKTPEDMRKISLRDKKRIFAWFDSAIGLRVSKEEENFTKS